MAAMITTAAVAGIEYCLLSLQTVQAPVALSATKEPQVFKQDLTLVTYL